MRSRGADGVGTGPVHRQSGTGCQPRCPVLCPDVRRDDVRHVDQPARVRPAREEQRQRSGHLGFSESFTGRQSTRPKGGTPGSIRVSHYKGFRPDAWRARLETFDSLDLGELYPGIRVELQAAGNGADTGCGIDGACDPVDPFSPTPDGFVARLSADLSQLEYGSHLGGSGEDRPLVIALDEAGLVHAAGYTRSVDFPTTVGAFDSTSNGGTSDAFISRIDAGPMHGMIFADDFESGSVTRWE